MSSQFERGTMTTKRLISKVENAAKLQTSQTGELTPVAAAMLAAAAKVKS